MNKLVRLTSLLGLLGLVFVASGVAYAAAGTPAQSEAITVRATVLPTVQITLTQNSGAAVNAGANPFDFGNVTPLGSPYLRQLEATVSSNVTYRLRVYKDVDMTGTGGTPPVIPSANLTWGLGASPCGACAFTAFTGSAAAPQNVVTAQAPGTGLIHNITYRLQIDWTQIADTYTATHTWIVDQ